MDAAWDGAGRSWEQQRCPHLWTITLPRGLGTRLDVLQGEAGDLQQGEQPALVASSCPCTSGFPGNHVYEVLHIANGAVTTSLMPVCCCAG